MDNLVKVSVVDMRKDTEHLFVDSLALGKVLWWEASFLADPSLGIALVSSWCRNNGRGVRSRDSVLWAGWEKGFVGKTIIDPGHHIFNIRRSRERTGLLVCVKPVIIGSVYFKLSFISKSDRARPQTMITQKQKENATHPGPADIEGHVEQNSATTLLKCFRYSKNSNTKKNNA